MERPGPQQTRRRGKPGPPRREAAVRNAFIRGSVVRYIVLPPDGVDAELLHDATRREARGQ